jgi:transposase
VKDQDDFKSRKPRRTFKPEFKAEIVRLVAEGKPLKTVAREYGLTPSSVQYWVQQAQTDAQGGEEGPLTTAEREELLALRRRVKRLETEQEILKKATAFFAKEQY